MEALPFQKSLLSRNSIGDQGQVQARVGDFKVFILQFQGIIQVLGMVILHLRLFFTLESIPKMFSRFSSFTKNLDFTQIHGFLHKQFQMIKSD